MNSLIIRGDDMKIRVSSLVSNLILVACLSISLRAWSSYTPKCVGYAPDHTWEQLNAVIRWSAGDAFAIYAARAGFRFDYESYQDDVPHRALYNFGRATGTTCLPNPTTLGYEQMMVALSVYYSKTLDQQGKAPVDNLIFRENYLRLAESWGFLDYLSEIPEGLLVIQVDGTMI